VALRVGMDLSARVLRVRACGHHLPDSSRPRAPSATCRRRTGRRGPNAPEGRPGYRWLGLPVDHRRSRTRSTPGLVACARSGRGARPASGRGRVPDRFPCFPRNSFASATIEVASEQKVIDTGPYSRVRHPMYTGALVLLAGTPLALGSFWGMLVLFPFTAVIVWRLLDEEKFLVKDLSTSPRPLFHIVDWVRSGAGAGFGRCRGPEAGARWLSRRYRNRVGTFSVCRVGNDSPCTICKRPLSRIGTVALTASSRRTRRSTGHTGGAHGHRRLRSKDLQGA